MRIDLPSIRVLAALATLAACGPSNVGGDDSDVTSEAGGTSPAPTNDGPTGPGTPTTGSESTGDPPITTDSTGVGPGSSEPGTDSGCGFICAPDMPSSNPDCDGTHQLDPDCPEGHKCTIEGGLGDTQCVPVVRVPKGLHEPCTIDGNFFDGIDDCDVGMICWAFDATATGICLGLCDGSESGDCDCPDPTTTPTWCQECAVGICFPSCDPIEPDCPGDQLCISSYNGDGFQCTLDASGDEGQVNDPCEYVNTCDPGLTCLDTAAASSVCDPAASGCCQPFCEFPGAPCPNPDQTCQPWFEDPPAGLENIGVCAATL